VGCNDIPPTPSIIYHPSPGIIIRLPYYTRILLKTGKNYIKMTKIPSFKKWFQCAITNTQYYTTLSGNDKIYQFVYRRGPFIKDVRSKGGGGSELMNQCGRPRTDQHKPNVNKQFSFAFRTSLMDDP